MFKTKTKKVTLIPPLPQANRVVVDEPEPSTSQATIDDVTVEDVGPPMEVDNPMDVDPYESIIEEDVPAKTGNKEDQTASTAAVIADFLESPIGVCVAISSLMASYLALTNAAYYVLKHIGAPATVVAVVGQFRKLPQNFVSQARVLVAAVAGRFRADIQNATNTCEDINPEIATAPSPPPSIYSGTTPSPGVARQTRSTTNARKVEFSQLIHDNCVDEISYNYNITTSAAGFVSTHNLLDSSEVYPPLMDHIDEIINADIYNEDIFIFL